MRLPKRTLLLITSSLVVVMLASATVAYRAASSYAAPRTTTATYTGSYGAVGRANQSKTVPSGIQPNLAAVACSNDTDINYTGGCAAHSGGDAATRSQSGTSPSRHLPAVNSPFNHNASSNTTGGKGAPKVVGSALAKPGSLVANFNGVSDVDSHTANGFHVTPPDQGLCVGPASALQGAGVSLAVPGNTSVVLEAVNDAWTVYSTSGAVLFGPDSLADLFSDPNASGDVSCNFDTATQSFYFAEIGGLLSGPDAGNFGTDLAVINANGYAPYQVDTSVNANCFPDFPQIGYDSQAFYLAINEFCGPNEVFAGTILWGISKSQLAGESSSVNFVTFGPLALSGDPVLTLRPAIGNQSDTEYLVNSWPYDQFGNNNNIASTLGLWNVRGDKNITSGHGAVTLSGRNISSETYAFPVPAASTGDGSTPPGAQSFVISEPFLNTDDSRAEQVQLANTPQGLRLYTSLNTALAVGNDPSARDGAAWFEIDPKAQRVTNQGYIGVAGTYLLYPSILRGNSGTLVIDFSMTSPTLNPGTGYVYMKSGGHSFSSVQTTGVGSGPHVSFSDVLFAEPRWGDYSAIALDPNSNNIWTADEYIPPANEGGSDLVDNWGTRVWAVAG